MVQHQVVLMCRKLTRMQSGVNLPLSEVIMSRSRAIDGLETTEIGTSSFVIPSL